MEYTVKYSLSALSLVCALLLSVGYVRFTDGRLLEYRAYIRLLSHVERSLITRAATVAEWSRGYVDEVLWELGFLPALQSGAGLKEAYFSTLGKSAASKEGTELLTELFSEYGKSYLDREIALVKEAALSLERLYLREGEELMKSRKLFRTVVFAVALGIIILLI